MTIPTTLTPPLTTTRIRMQTEREGMEKDEETVSLRGVRDDGDLRHYWVYLSSCCCYV